MAAHSCGFYSYDAAAAWSHRDVSFSGAALGEISMCREVGYSCPRTGMLQQDKEREPRVRDQVFPTGFSWTCYVTLAKSHDPSASQFLLW